MMTREDEILTFLNEVLNRQDYHDISSLLTTFGLTDVESIYSFMNDMEGKGYIEWRDETPAIDNFDGEGGRGRDSSQELKFTAKIMLSGIEYLEEKRLKIGNKNFARNSYIVAAIALAVTSLQWGLSYFKNEKTKDDFRILNTRIDSLAKVINKQSLVIQSKKDLTRAGATPDHHPVNEQNRRPHAVIPKKSPN